MDQPLSTPKMNTAIRDAWAFSVVQHWKEPPKKTTFHETLSIWNGVFLVV